MAAKNWAALAGCPGAKTGRMTRMQELEVEASAEIQRARVAEAGDVPKGAGAARNGQKAGAASLGS